MTLRQGYIQDNIGYIPLTRGLWTLCDAYNFHWLSQWNWFAHYDPMSGHWYAARNVSLTNGKRTSQYMARVIVGVTDPKIQVDHKNREATLDNRTSNLRTTAGQNQQNVGLRKDSSSGFKGVYWDKSRNKWRAQIRYNGKHIHLGYFADKVDAALAYDAAALLYHKEFAVLNFPPKKPAARVSAELERKAV